MTEKDIESVEVIPTTRTPLVNEEEKLSSEEVTATTSVPEVIVSSVSEFSEPESTTQPTNRIEMVEKVVTAPAIAVGEEILEPTTRLPVSREPEVTTIVSTSSSSETSTEIPNIVVDEVETPSESPLEVTSRPEEALHISSTLRPEITTRIEPQPSISEVTTRIPDHIVLDEAVNEIVPEEAITEKSVSEPEVVKPTTMITPSEKSNEVIEIVSERPSLVEEVVTEKPESHPPKIEEKIDQPVTESSPLEITTTLNVDQPLPSVSSSTPPPPPSSSTESEEVVEVVENEVEDLIIKAVTTQTVPIKDEPVAITTVLPELSSEISANEVTEAPLVPTNPVPEIKTDSQSTPESVQPEEPVVTTQAIEPLKETIVETTSHTPEVEIKSQSTPATAEESVPSSSTPPSMVENETTTATQPETIPEESDVTTGRSDFSIGGSDVTTKTPPSSDEEVMETTSPMPEVRVHITTPSGGEVITIKFEENVPTQVPMDEGMTTPRTLQDTPVTVKVSPEESRKPEPGSKLTETSVEIEVTTSPMMNGEVTTKITTSMVPGFEQNFSFETTTSSVPPPEITSTESSVTSTENLVTSTKSPVTSTESPVTSSESSNTSMGELTTMNDDGEVIEAGSLMMDEAQGGSSSSSPTTSEIDSKDANDLNPDDLRIETTLEPMSEKAVTIASTSVDESPVTTSTDEPRADVNEEVPTTTSTTIISSPETVADVITSSDVASITKEPTSVLPTTTILPVAETTERPFSTENSTSTGTSSDSVTVTDKSTEPESLESQTTSPSSKEVVTDQTEVASSTTPTVGMTTTMVPVVLNVTSNGTAEFLLSSSTIPSSGTSTISPIDNQQFSDIDSSKILEEEDGSKFCKLSRLIQMKKNIPFLACVFEGRVYQSAEQIPRPHPCDFCFCFRGDIICLQQTCPPPIPRCYETPIQGFCCPRYECRKF